MRSNFQTRYIENLIMMMILVFITLAAVFFG